MLFLYVRNSQDNQNNDIISILQSQILSGMEDQILKGILYHILTSNGLTPQCLITINLFLKLKISNTKFLNTIKFIINSYLMYFRPKAIEQLFIFINKLILNNLNNINNKNNYNINSSIDSILNIFESILR